MFVFEIWRTYVLYSKNSSLQVLSKFIFFWNIMFTHPKTGQIMKGFYYLITKFLQNGIQLSTSQYSCETGRYIFPKGFSIFCWSPVMYSISFIVFQKNDTTSIFSLFVTNRYTIYSDIIYFIVLELWKYGQLISKC